jgi:hypothetical protein
MRSMRFHKQGNASEGPKGRQCVGPAVRPGQEFGFKNERRRRGTVGVPVLRTSDSGSWNSPPHGRGYSLPGLRPY